MLPVDEPALTDLLRIFRVLGREHPTAATHSAAVEGSSRSDRLVSDNGAGMTTQLLPGARAVGGWARSPQAGRHRSDGLAPGGSSDRSCPRRARSYGQPRSLGS